MEQTDEALKESVVLGSVLEGFSIDFLASDNVDYVTKKPMLLAQIYESRGENLGYEEVANVHFHKAEAIKLRKLLTAFIKHCNAHSRTNK